MFTQWSGSVSVSQKTQSQCPPNLDNLDRQYCYGLGLLYSSQDETDAPQYLAGRVLK